ncbi:hypothetical protein DFH07DRAFT_150670 [Mycena maculata]|uniref:Uncharacterized protein n=1 Tax=Mycena maculata TaxID=230809 RepID=A0AAD7MSY8_9AGAR|nr:hypothetical protein DFH07DRAFT_150670 [Mycena maculata]
MRWMRQRGGARALHCGSAASVCGRTWTMRRTRMEREELRAVNGYDDGPEADAEGGVLDGSARGKVMCCSMMCRCVHLRGTQAPSLSITMADCQTRVSRHAAIHHRARGRLPHPLPFCLLPSGPPPHPHPHALAPTLIPQVNPPRPPIAVEDLLCWTRAIGRMTRMQRDSTRRMRWIREDALAGGAARVDVADEDDGWRSTRRWTRRLRGMRGADVEGKAMCCATMPSTMAAAKCDVDG